MRFASHYVSPLYGVITTGIGQRYCMSRCGSTDKLQVHHKRRDGGNDIGNAEVLCQECHENTSTYGVHGKKSPDFSEATKKEALKRAGYSCECERTGCHNNNETTTRIIKVVSDPMRP